MSDKLEQARNEYLDKVKKIALLDAGVEYEDVDKYVKYVNVDDEGLIKREADAIVADIKQQNTTQYGDPGQNTVWRPFI